MLEESKRTGLIARKVGMTHIYSEKGLAIPVTLLKADENFVIDVKTTERDGYNAIVLGFGEAKAKRVSKSLKGICAKANVKPVKHVKEFRIAADAVMQLGQQLSVEHFLINQNIDIQGKNTGKGFAGGMKRHNFRGLEATHGVSVTHRSHGSTGNRQDPGRTFPGKKMAGHLGAETVTVQNVKVVNIDLELGLIAVNGSVPGKNGSYVYLKDAVKSVLPYNVAYPAALKVSAAVADNNKQTAVENSETPESTNS